VDECGDAVAETSPDKLSTRPGGRGRRAKPGADSAGYPTGTPLIDTNRSEPISSQIGLSDLVSVSDSFKGLWRLASAGDGTKRCELNG